MITRIHKLPALVPVMNAIHLTVSLSVLALVVGCNSNATAEAGKLPTGRVAGDMDLSPFYRWDSTLPESSGVLLREEPITLQSDIDTASEAVRILYTSTDVRWHSGQVPVSGTLYLPSGNPPEKGWPLLAWGHGTLGVADVCAPSWTTFKARDAEYLKAWLKEGFAVVATDYQGLGGPGPHPYLYWQAEARSILDSIRAAIGARSGQISNRVFIAGQSQGAGAALGAATLVHTYAPELNILGIVATGPNSTYPDGPVALPVRNSHNMFLSFVSGGLRDDAPAIDELVNDKGKQLLDVARQACTNDIVKLAHQLKVRELADVFSVSMEQFNAFRIPVTDRPMEKVDIPYLIATGLADDTVVPLRQYAIVAALCASGNNVSWLNYEGLDHDDALYGSFEDSLSFARSLLKGDDVTGNCASISSPTPPGEG